MPEPRWTKHAARMVLKRKLDPLEVLSLAQDAMNAGVTGTIEKNKLVVVMGKRGSIITTYKRNLFKRARRNQRTRRKKRTVWSGKT